jgi:DNA-binding PadR family transcriptional regulator
VPAGLHKSQVVICRQIAKGGAEMGHASMQELMELLPHKPSRQALHYSIKFLEKKGFAKSLYRTHEGKRHRVVTLTEHGFAVMRFLDTGNS